MVFHFLHINLRSINKNFENFKLFLSSSGFILSVFSETWLYEITSSNKHISIYELPNHASIHKMRKKRTQRTFTVNQTIYRVLKMD